MKPNRVLFAPEARDQARLIDAWWREHRPRAPRLFAEELAHALALLGGVSKVGRPYPHPRREGVRRLPLRSTRYHLYYRTEEDVVIVLAVWSSVRGTGPDLTPFGRE
jgi:plasmid stabilization system protein ParE